MSLKELEKLIKIVERERLISGDSKMGFNDEKWTRISGIKLA
jgi:hypothetical protein